MRYKWIQDVIRPEPIPIEESNDTGIVWLWQQFLSVQTQVRALVAQYKHDPESAIVKAAEALGMTHAELIQRASSIQESQLCESWFEDILSWWGARISTFITGLQQWMGSSITIACTIMAMATLGLITMSRIPFLSKLAVWIYAYYLVDKQGRSKLE